ncbi:MAG: LytR C-terminal domain-containing protein [Nocardioidaceae bacterium]
MTAITLLVLVAILVIGAVIGADKLFAPLPTTEQPVATPSPTCTVRTVKKGQRVVPRQVQVSVFNGGHRAGLAGTTMRSLSRRGFRQGKVGNAPSSVKVRRVQVWTTFRNDDGARLVARQFGRTTKVRITRTDLGPGVDVVIGDNFRKLAKGKRFVVVRRSSSVCVPLPSPAG